MGDYMELRQEDTGECSLNKEEEYASSLVGKYSPTYGKGTATNVKVYKRRWYILAVFFMSGALQAFVRSTWGPLAESVEMAFGWTNADIALLNSWGQITVLTSAPFFTWLMAKKGLRFTSLLVAALLLVATAIKCAPSTQLYSRWTQIQLAQILNGLGGLYFEVAPPLISTLWFPVEERNTATAVGALIGGFGEATSFLVGPQIVTVPMTPSRNTTSCHRTGNGSSCLDLVPPVASTRHRIMLLNYLQCVIAVLMFLATLFYFPCKPPQPPSYSATIERVNYAAGFKTLLANKTFWLLTNAFALCHAFVDFWADSMDISLMALDVSQKSAGLIGLCLIFASVLAATLMARIADMYLHQTKPLIIGSLSCGLVWTIVYSLHYVGYIPRNITLLYVCAIGIGIFVSGPSPVMTELLCDTTYPIPEEVTNGLVMCYTVAVQLLCNIILMSPHVGTVWISWTAVGCVTMSIVLFSVAKESYARHDVDLNTKLFHRSEQTPSRSDESLCTDAEDVIL